MNFTSSPDMHTLLGVHMNSRIVFDHVIRFKFKLGFMYESVNALLGVSP